MRKIFIFGCSGHARVVVDIVEKQGEFEPAGFVDTFVARGADVMGLPVLGTEAELPELMRGHAVSGGIVAIGDNSVRAAVVRRVREIVPEFEFVVAIHPSAQIGRGVSLGAGTVVMPGAVIGVQSVVGEHCILNTNASIDHDNRLGSFSSVAPGVAIGGNVTVGEFSAISLGANVIHGRTIGSHTIVGAGATVVEDLPESVVAYGTPARVIRSRKPGEKYLG